MNVIPYGKQNITEIDIEAVVRVLKSDFLTQGPVISEFENAFSKYIGCKYSVAVANGTAALHLCALALDVKPGDKVITTPITFAASANCIRYCGGDVVFSDIDPETYLLDIEGVRELLKSVPMGTYKGIIPVDFAGRAVDLQAFRQLADEYDLWIIEDACHAPGGYFINNKGQKQNCGNGKYAELSIFSFHPVKHIATGEGGMISTNNETLYKKLLTLRTHGITKDPECFQNSITFASGLEENAHHLDHWPTWYMEMQTLGFNYRLTDLQAALGLSQLLRADSGITRRRAIADKYSKSFTGKPFLKGQSGSVKGHAYHLYIIEVKDRIGLYYHLRRHNISPQIHYVPCHLMPYYREQGWHESQLPYSETYYKNCISLPMYPSLTDSEQEYVIKIIYDYYEN